ncbi:MAG: transcriptional regulator, MerR family [Proteobacteria bacterium]|nr:transcriptional regulator, MerR family [Pseudomonadota bacterium]
MENEDPRSLPQLSSIILEELSELTLAEVSHACAVPVDCIVELVAEGLLDPRGGVPHRWRFSGTHLRRATVALRLRRELSVNLAGAALALQLQGEVDALRTRLRIVGVS